MRTSHLIFRLSAAAMIGGLIGWRLGYETSSKLTQADPVQCGLDIKRQLKVYQAIETTNLSEAEWNVGMHILEMTHDYDRWFGVPDPTNKFAKGYKEARAITERFEHRIKMLSLTQQAGPLPPGRPIRRKPVTDKE